MNEQALTGAIVVPTNKAIGPEGMDSRREGRYAQFLRSDIQEDAGLLRAKINRDRKILDSTDPKNMSSEQKLEIDKQIKKDSTWVKNHMCPKKLFNVRREDPDFARAVEACKVEHTEKYKSVANRLKENLRRIDPDSESNLERFRPKS